MQQAVISAAPWLPQSRPNLLLTSAQIKLLSSVSLALTLTAPLWLWALFFASNHDYGFALVAVPIVWLLNIGLISAVTRNSPGLRRIMLVSFWLKVASTGAYAAITFRYLGGGFDANAYFEVAEKLSTYFGVYGYFPVTGHLVGTDFINVVTAALITVINPSFPTISLIFASLGFWGMFFFFEAFRAIFPSSQYGFAALLLFLLPSCQFWTAFIGKDPLMMLAIGGASFGFALLLRDNLGKGLLLLAVSLMLAAIIRPHVAAMMAIALVVPYVFSSGRRGAYGALAKLLGIPMVLAGTAYLILNVSALSKVESVQGGVEFAHRVGVGMTSGGSAFGAGQSLATRLLLSPLLMFRPLPWEVPNVLGVASMLESLLLIYLLWRTRQYLASTFLQWRTHLFETYIAAFGAIFSLIFSLAMSNFGTLLRQRTMFLPLLLILIAAGWNPYHGKGKDRVSGPHELPRAPG